MPLVNERQLAKELSDQGKTNFEIAAALNRAGFNKGLGSDGKPNRYSMQDIPDLLSGQAATDRKVEAAMVDKGRELLAKNEEDPHAWKQDGRFQHGGRR